MIPAETIVKFKRLAERFNDGDFTLHSGAIMQLLVERESLLTKIDQADELLTNLAACWQASRGGNPASLAELNGRMNRLVEEML